MTDENSTRLPHEPARSTMTAIYGPLVHAAVQTRRDTDRITFQYVVTLTGVLTVLASDFLELDRITTRVGATVVVLAILGVAIMTLRQRVKIYSLIFENLIRLETALGAFHEGALKVYDPAGYLKNSGYSSLLPGGWQVDKLEFAKRQHWPHLAGLAGIALVTVVAIWTMKLPP